MAVYSLLSPAPLWYDAKVSTAVLRPTTRDSVAILKNMLLRDTPANTMVASPPSLNPPANAEWWVMCVCVYVYVLVCQW